MYDSKSRQLIGFGFVCWGRSKEEAALEVFKMASLSTKLVVDYKREWNVALCKDRDVLTWQSGNSAAILSGRVAVYVRLRHGKAIDIADMIYEEIKFENLFVDVIKRLGSRNK
ncbi:MAG: hypothetical protein MJ109_00970 [Kiritimatiellae bacterium]|nr:hypothetical protein [Kiritimatiellia bacterium]